MTKGRNHTGLPDDSRAVGRTLLFGLLGIGLVVLVGFLVFGGVVVDGGSEKPAAETPADGPATDPSETGPSEGNGSSPDPPETVDVEFDVWEQEVGDEFQYVNLTLRNETGGVVEETELNRVPSTTFENLTYNGSYILTAEADGWPDKRLEFRAGEFDEEDLVVGYEFQSADSFGYSAYVNLTEINREKHETKGLYDAGEALYYVQFLNDDGSEAADVGYFTHSNGTTYGLGNNGEEPTRYSYPGWGYADFRANSPVFRGLDEYENRTFLTKTEISKNLARQFITTKTANRTLDVYEIDISSHYSDGEAGNLYNTASAYVDPQTGYVVRVETDGIVFADPRSGSDWYHNAGTVIYEFYDFEQNMSFSREDLSVKPP